ncbi:MAG: EamA family transporter [Candidatus Izemoplasmatales bacterium]|nr:EamA family transporter [Candidatus Izemoplasmatales bacterium]MDY0138396.1 EamA family transporter [Candidatus Izemoplasmatales bacterium]
MNKKAHLSGLMFSIIFGFSFMMSKTALEYISPIGLIAYRFLLAFITFEVLRLTKVIKIRINLKESVSILLVAFFQPILYFLFETYGLKETTSAEAGLMIALIPIFVTILSTIILKEKPLVTQLLFILLSVAGVVFIQLYNTNISFDFNSIGFRLLLMAVISAALFNIASRNAAKNHKPHEITYIMMLMGAVCFNVIYIYQLINNKELPSYFSNLMNVEVILPIVYLGIVASILGFFLVNFSLSKLPAHISSIYSNISTMVAVIAGAIFLNEKVEFYHIIGGLMIVVGVYGAARINYLRNRRVKKL